MVQNNMSEKIKLSLSRIGNGLFVPALNKLCSLTVHSGRDTYALVRTVEKINPELEAYRATKESLLKKHGATSNLAALRAVLEKLPADSPARVDQEKKLAALAPYEQLVLAPDAPAHAAFLAEMTSVDETAVELFLDHKIPLALDRVDGVFTAFELKELVETVVEIAP